ncbi:MAG TPA: hypothetical protein DC049_19915 [Spirochaetia bacterium]|nr:hypothetical protein [Spirochaetia bacterium]
MLNKTKKIVFKNNPFAKKGRWLKANLHTHTTNSDGILSPRDAILKYAQHGYQVLAITDHNRCTIPDASDTGGLLLIPAAEYHPLNSINLLSKKHHFVCLNVKKEIENIQSIHAQDLIDEILAQNGMVIAGHPYWLKQNIYDLASLRGISAIEVYNTTCGRVGRELSDQIWDDYCCRVKPVYGIADDDCHFKSPEEFAGGWIWIKAEESSLETVMSAIKNGEFYSSTGPLINDISLCLSEPDHNNWQGIQVTAECSPARSVCFIAPYGGAQVFAEAEKTIEKASAVLNPKNPFLRVEIRGHDGKTAWSNPIEIV